MNLRYVTLITPGGPVLAWSNEAWAQVADHYGGVKLPYSKRSLIRSAASCSSGRGAPRPSRAASMARRTGSPEAAG